MESRLGLKIDLLNICPDNYYAFFPVHLLFQLSLSRAKFLFFKICHVTGVAPSLLNSEFLSYNAIIMHDKIQGVYIENQ